MAAQITQTYINELIDDLWIDTFIHLNVKDFISVNSTCRHFYKLTSNTTTKAIVNYWKAQCNRLCINVAETRFKTKDWKAFYSILSTFCHTYGYIDNKKTVEQLTTPIDLYLKSETTEKQKLTDNPVLRAIMKDNSPIYQMLTLGENDGSDVNRKVYPTCWYPKRKRSKKQRQIERTALWLCAKYDAVKIAQYLLGNKQIDINIREGICQETPLMQSVTRGSINVFKILLKHPKMTKKSINMIDSDGGWTAFYNAVCMADESDENFEILQLLLNDKRVDPNVTDFLGQTPLMGAIAGKVDPKVILLLLENTKISPHETDSNGRNVMYYVNQFLTQEKDKQRYNEIIHILKSKLR